MYGKNSMYLKFRVNIRNLDPVQNHVMDWNNLPLHQQFLRNRHARNYFQLLTVSPDFGDVEILEVGHLNEKQNQYQFRFGKYKVKLRF